MSWKGGEVGYLADIPLDSSCSGLPTIYPGIPTRFSDFLPSLADEARPSNMFRSKHTIAVAQPPMHPRLFDRPDDSLLSSLVLTNKPPPLPYRSLQRQSENKKPKFYRRSMLKNYPQKVIIDRLVSCICLVCVCGG